MGRVRSRRIVSVVAVAGALVASGCGGGGGGPEVITGRVMSRTDARYCVSDDRGATETCVDVDDPRAIEGVDVGECVETTTDLTSEDSRVEVVDEAACAAGDLGD